MSWQCSLCLARERVVVFKAAPDRWRAPAYYPDKHGRELRLFARGDQQGQATAIIALRTLALADATY
eukprot:7171960-Lingulodinium_polyedra.AAC.1